MTIPDVSTSTAREAVPSFNVTWMEGVADWSLEPRFPGDTSPRELRKLLPHASLRFAFSAPHRTLESLSIVTATYARRNTAKLWCQISDSSGRPIKQVTLMSDEVRDAASTRFFDLRDIEFQVGAQYEVTVASPDATEDDSYAVYVHDVVPGRYEVHRNLVALPDRRIFVERAEADGIDGPAAAVVLAVAGATGIQQWILDRALSGMRLHFGDEPVLLVDLDDFPSAWRKLARARVAVFCDTYQRSFGAAAITFDALCFALHRIGVATCFLDIGPARGVGLRLTGHLSSQERERRAQRRRCHFVLAGAEGAAGRPDIEAFDGWREDGGHPASTLADRLVARTRVGRSPHVVVVTVLYRKAAVIRDFLTRVITQSYDGPITIVLVDDLSPENEVEISREVAQALESTPNRRIEIVEQEHNSGNCASRLRGLAAVQGDLYVVMDCDCLMNRDFVAAHVFEHWDPTIDVVVGISNIESDADDPLGVVRTLEHDPAQALGRAQLQDEVQLNGFLNCITRNFSIKASLLDAAPLFDLDFSYSSKSGSGFGWEDVEMGYRLYKRGGRIRFTRDAFAVHCTHGSSIPEGEKIIGSMRNFLRLFTKHEELRFVARRWALETYRRICLWADDAGVDGGETRARLDEVLRDASVEMRPLTTAYRPGHRRLRVLSYRWHAPHQYELYKLPHDFTLVTGLGLPMVDTWSFDQRPLRPNVRFLDARRVDTRDYDVAVLHFDENANCSDLSNGTLPAVWGDPMRRFLAISNLPKVAICHGTPTFEGQYGLDPNRKLAFNEHARRKAELVGMMAQAGVHVVCNSHQAHREWGFARSSVIWHGFDPQEFPAGTRERHILALSPDIHRPHYRGAWEHATVAERLDAGIRVETAAHPGSPIERRDGNAFAEKNFRSYIDRIRQFTVYLNTTLRSPMPRSRGEAMMTGVIPVCLANHDVERFIRNGENGFYSDSPEELADRINFLFRNPDEAARVSAGARRTAIDVFNHDRYLRAWVLLLKEAAA